MAARRGESLPCATVSSPLLTLLDNADLEINWVTGPEDDDEVGEEDDEIGEEWRVPSAGEQGAAAEPPAPASHPKTMNSEGLHRPSLDTSNTQSGKCTAEEQHGRRLRHCGPHDPLT